MKRFPVLFLGHGSPMNIAQKNEFTDALGSFARKLPRPDAVFMVSAHWTARSTMVTGNENPPQIYDFYGFPDELYRVSYTPRSSLALAEKTSSILDSPLSEDWGIDHGAWSVLMRLFPEADVPVTQLSLDMTKGLDYHYETGRKLAALRDENILIIGSGNIVHNLRDISYEQYDPEVAAWASDFDRVIAEDLSSAKHDRLVSFDKAYGGLAQRAHPTLDHYLPLLYAAGAAGNDAVSFIHEGFQHATLSMRCVLFGEL